MNGHVFPSVCDKQLQATQVLHEFGGKFLLTCTVANNLCYSSSIEIIKSKKVNFILYMYMVSYAKTPSV